MNKLKKIIFIVGPTAIGKSDVAFFLAKKLSGEIVSCDSMQIYKEINIASNKPACGEMKEVVHHLINVVSVKDKFDVAKYNELAIKAIAGIHKKNCIAIVAGGSGMYMQILLDGIFTGASGNKELRDDLMAQAKEKGSQNLYDQLLEKDPAAAGKIHPNDLRRIVRALEVCLTEGEGKIFSELKQERAGLWGKYDISIYGLNCARGSLYERINQRTDKMFDKGLISEVREIKSMNLSKTAAAIIGVGEVLGFLRGEYDVTAAKEAMKQNTRRLAKRQLTWFRKEKRIQWIDVEKFRSFNDIAEYIYRKPTA